MALTEYPQLEAIMKAFEPYGNMWKMCAEFSRNLPEWMDGPFTALDPENVTNLMDTWYRGVMKAMKTLKGPPQEVCEALKEKIVAFQDNLPLIVALRNPGLRDRHWTRMSNDLGFPVKAGLVHVESS
jgi:dynein heavy chain